MRTKIVYNPKTSRALTALIEREQRGWVRIDDDDGVGTLMDGHHHNTFKLYPSLLAANRNRLDRKPKIVF
jgi:hypothetical protein